MPAGFGYKCAWGTDKQRLLEHLLNARDLSYTMDRDEIIEGIRFAAAPVHRAEGKVAASLCMPGAALRMLISWFCSLGRLAAQVADTIRERLGNV
jgi:DNA-binding IclR family transcriptional regulator